MSRYHINNKGNVGLCRAEEDKCPFAPDSQHYATKQQAREAYEKRNALFEKAKAVPSKPLDELLYEDTAKIGANWAALGREPPRHPVETRSADFLRKNERKLPKFMRTLNPDMGESVWVDFLSSVDYAQEFSDNPIMETLKAFSRGGIPQLTKWQKNVEEYQKLAVELVRRFPDGERILKSEKTLVSREKAKQVRLQKKNEEAEQERIYSPREKAIVENLAKLGSDLSQTMKAKNKVYEKVWNDFQVEVSRNISNGLSYPHFAAVQTMEVGGPSGLTRHDLNGQEYLQAADYLVERISY